MLYLLTGDIQTGKTRWLESLVGVLADADIVTYGVLAPGVWVPSTNEHADANGFEKLGIDNVLLPSGDRIRLAVRGDIARAQGMDLDGVKGAAKGMRWHFDSDALQQVNDYLSNISAIAKQDDNALLVIDEIGPLELAGEGLTNATALLKAGPQGPIKDALVVVRETLLDAAEKEFAPAWGEVERIAPTEKESLEILQHFAR